MATLKSILSFVNWRSFLWAGLLANVAKFIVFSVTGNEPLVGGQSLLPDASPFFQYGVAALLFMVFGQGFYALVYVYIFHNATGFASGTLWDRIMKAVVAGFAMGFIGIIVMPYVFTVEYLGPNPAHPEIMVDWNLLPWDYIVCWERLFIYLVFALVMVFVYKSPAEKLAKKQAMQPVG